MLGTCKKKIQAHVEKDTRKNVHKDLLTDVDSLRALNYRNINPDTNTFLNSFKSLMITNLLSPHSKFANCEVDDGDSLLHVSFLFDDTANENENISNTSFIIPSTSQTRHCPISQGGSLISKVDVVLEKIKVQCSAYTAGYLCRKLTKKKSM